MAAGDGSVFKRARVTSTSSASMMLSQFPMEEAHVHMALVAQLDAMLEQVCVIKEAHGCRCRQGTWKGKPDNRDYMSPSVCDILEHFAFEKQLVTDEAAAAAAVAADTTHKFDILARCCDVVRHNRELLIFDLRAQLVVFTNWWTMHYSIKRARVQYAPDVEEASSNGFRVPEDIRHQLGLYVPLLQEAPVIPSGIRHLLSNFCIRNNIILPPAAAVPLPRLAISLIWQYADLPVFPDGINHLIWQYVDGDCHVRIHDRSVCSACATPLIPTAGTAFPVICMPLLPARAPGLITSNRRLESPPPEAKFWNMCNARCAWTFMRRHLVIVDVAGESYVLLPCVYLVCNRDSLRIDIEHLLRCQQHAAERPPFLITHQAVVRDTFVDWPDYECTVVQVLASLTHQPNCVGSKCFCRDNDPARSNESNGCWTYLPLQLLPSF